MNSPVLTIARGVYIMCFVILALTANHWPFNERELRDVTPLAPLPDPPTPTVMPTEPEPPIPVYVAVDGEWLRRA